MDLEPICLRELTELEELFTSLAAKCNELAAALGAGLPPAHDPLAGLADAREHFARLRGRALALAQAEALEVTEPVESTSGLRGLVERVQRAAEARAAREAVQSERLASARRALDQVLDLRHRDSIAFQPLEDCQVQALGCADRISGPSTAEDPELTSLAAGEHPFCALLRLVEVGKTLDEIGWFDLVETVGTAFGKPLAAAAARGKLVLGSTQRPKIGSPSTPPSVSEAAGPRATPEAPPSARPPEDVAEPSAALPVPEVSGPSEVPAAAPSGVASEPASVAPAGQAEPPPPAAEPPPSTAEPPRAKAGLPPTTDEPPKPAAPPAAEEWAPSSAPACMPARAAPPVCQSDVAPPSAAGAPAADGAKRVNSGLGAEAAARDAAATLQAAGRPWHPADLEDLAWRLVREGRLSAAFHLARCREIAWPESPIGLPAALVKAVALAPLVRSPSGQAVMELRPAMQEVLATLAGAADRAGRDRGVRLLAFGACIRPALLAPLAGAVPVLEAIALGDLPDALRGLREDIRGYARLGLELGPTILKGVREHAAWAQELAELRAECRDSLARARQANLIYAATTDVWRDWLANDGPIGRVLRAVIDDDRSHRGAVHTAVSEWSQHTHVAAQLARTDQKIRGRGAKLRPIDARAKTAATKHTRELLVLAERWLDLLAREPDSHGDFGYRQADECRAKVLGHLDAAGRQLVALLGAKPQQVSPCAGIACLKRALDDLGTLFDPNRSEPPDLLRPRHILGADLLRLDEPPVELDDEWEPSEHDAGPLLDALVGLCAKSDQDWRGFFQQRHAAGNHVATARLIDLFAATAPGAVDLEGLRKTREDGVEACRKGLTARLEETRVAIEQSHDLLTESDYNEYRSQLESLAASDLVDFQAAHARLACIATELDRARALRVSQARERLVAADIERRDPAAYARIVATLDAGNYLAADEYIDMASAGEPIAEREEEGTALRRFFPGFVREIISFLSGPKALPALEIASRIGRGGDVGPVTMSGVPGPQAVGAQRMLEAWYRAKSLRSEQLEHALRGLLGAIGFEVSRLYLRAPGMAGAERWVDLQTVPLTERATCAIPQFGSQAAGRYALLCLWDLQTEEQIVEIAARAREMPVIVLYFGRLSEARRRDLQRLCIDRRRTLLVLDEALVYFLCQARGLRLPLFFECAFPFTVADPYTTTAGLVPIEMFFGRGRERDLVVGRLDGTSLVYGGRQLGKTALLRDAARRHHDPEQGSIVRWVDLKAEGIGVYRPKDDIWAVITHVLHAEGVIPSAQGGPDAIQKRVPEWLDKDPRRRIVLLLDEADAFLTSDSAEAYPNVERIKGLMDSTERRFKVVFAGLHNVQRTSRDVNTPLAHLGSPVCVGPLLEHGQWREARELVTRPLGMLGYRFESPDLPMRILSHTNCYPSLIQLFCKHLLAHATNPNRTLFDPREGPPRVITALHLEDAYQSQELRKAILDRFRWTLDLDPRYRLIALCIALSTIETRERGDLEQGFEATSVRDQALQWWPEGFSEDTSIEAFRTILDEMIGLGVLRRVGGSRYGLRSPNVLNLLGRAQEIEAQLLDAASMEPPLCYEAATFRRSLEGHGCSPLTAQQESDLRARLNGVAVVFGSPLAGLDDVRPSLERACPRGSFSAAEGLIDLRSFRDILQRSHREDGVSVLLVPTSTPWAEAWVDTALDALEARRSKTAFSRVVFVGDPKTAWWWAWLGAGARAARRERGLIELSLKPWSDSALRRWMDDELRYDNPDLRKRLAAVTGGWGALVKDLGGRCAESPVGREALMSALERLPVSSPHWWEAAAFIPEALPVLHVLRTIGEPLPVEDILGLVEEPGIGREHVERTIRWAELVRYVRMVGRDAWELDPLVARLLGCPPA